MSRARKAAILVGFLAVVAAVALIVAAGQIGYVYGPLVPAPSG